MNIKGRRKYYLLLLLPVLIYIIWLLFPCQGLQKIPHSRVVYSKNGKLLRATLAKDGQFRMPEIEQKLPDKYIQAVTTFEDRYFYYHPGVNPFSILQAAITNIKQGKILTGGSTITMQLARLINPKKRTYFNKFLECLKAIKYELHFSKNQILKLYASYVPMGGNTVGVHTATQRYFGRKFKTITWSEAALFAILPNSPSMINLEHGRRQLKKKRNDLLKTLYKKGHMDSINYRLSCDESLPSLNPGVSFKAPHFCNFALDNSEENVIHSTLNHKLQKKVKEIADVKLDFLQSHGITNYSILVIDRQTQKIRSYLGSHSFFDSVHSGQVDGVQAPRSTGSLLKPFLAAKVVDRGPYNLQTKIQDVPTYYNNFVPSNASRTFQGLVTIEKMLRYSLNVPAVRLLNAFGIGDFLYFLEQAEFRHLRSSPSYYGLPLIIGGAEASLWELTRLFTALGNYGKLKPLRYIKGQKKKNKELFSPGSAWLVLKALKKIKRPGIEQYWHIFNNQTPIAWKTGTSYGHKDAWAIGVNKNWVVGVWTGNFSGRGVTDLYGSKAAGPILFKIFNNLTQESQAGWFERPDSSLELKKVCKMSGLSPNKYCSNTKKVFVPKRAYRVEKCNFHQMFVIDEATRKEVCSECWTISDTSHIVRTVLPAGVKNIYHKHSIAMDTIPEHNPNCPAIHSQQSFQLIYPNDDALIKIPRNFSGQYEKLVFSARHQSSAASLFWYLDGRFITETIKNHTVSINIEKGKHTLVVQDENGCVKKADFRVYKD